MSRRLTRALNLDEEGASAFDSESSSQEEYNTLRLTLQGEKPAATAGRELSAKRAQADGRPGFALNHPFEVVSDDEEDAGGGARRTHEPKHSKKEQLVKRTKGISTDKKKRSKKSKKRNKKKDKKKHSEAQRRFAESDEEEDESAEEDGLDIPLEELVKAEEEFVRDAHVQTEVVGKQMDFVNPDVEEEDGDEEDEQCHEYEYDDDQDEDEEGEERQLSKYQQIIELQKKHLRACLKSVGLHVKHSTPIDQLELMVREITKGRSVIAVANCYPEDVKYVKLPRQKIGIYCDSVEDLALMIERAQNIIVLTGAGVSVSCGIPDFRSANGIYAQIAEQYDVPQPECLFDIEFFKIDPRPFFSFAKEIFPNNFVPSPTHMFIKALEERGKLLRNYTQNIDTLEYIAGIKRVIYCHGSFATATCQRCSENFDGQVIKDDIMSGSGQSVSYCPKCTRGIVKPDITFFREALSESFYESLFEDLPKCDLLIIIGSSLKELVDAQTPQVLLNMERVGPPEHEYDCTLLGPCDATVQKLSRRLGWVLPRAPGAESRRKDAMEFEDEEEVREEMEEEDEDEDEEEGEYYDDDDEHGDIEVLNRQDERFSVDALKKISSTVQAPAKPKKFSIAWSYERARQKKEEKERARMRKAEGSSSKHGSSPVRKKSGHARSGKRGNTAPKRKQHSGKAASRGPSPTAAVLKTPPSPFSRSSAPRSASTNVVYETAPYIDTDEDDSDFEL